MTPLSAVLLLVVAQRLSELALAARNAHALKSIGGVETGAGHYPLMVLLHAAWLVAIAASVPSGTRPSWALLTLWPALLAARLWIIHSLGPFWTTRIITVPGLPLVRRGPYRWLRHPNYLIVALEIAVLPLAFGAWRVALVFSLLNAALLAWRIRIEDAALAPRRRLGQS
ncbi:MAG: hypothetical protein HQL40_00870 [Alphaproteobacteria bacterium]|nr:hypothetical protein [Alphaproteobacteria bacterium]